jgi:hypothetical protein
MGYVPYSLLIIIPNHLNLTFDDVVSALESFFAQIREPHTIVRINEKRVDIQNTKIDQWALSVEWQDDDVVQEEMRSFADSFAKERDDYDLIATCRQVINTGGDDDPNMDYFNTFVWTINAFERIPGVIIFDVNNSGFDY